MFHTEERIRNIFFFGQKVIVVKSLKLTLYKLFFPLKKKNSQKKNFPLKKTFFPLKKLFH